MKILWSYLSMLLIVYETSSQLTRQQTFSQSGNANPYILYFDAYMGGTLAVTFSTKCPNLRIIFMNSMASITSNYSTVGYNNGNNYSYSFGISMGTKQSISLIDWNSATTCNWSFNFMLNFSCSIVTPNCYDCSSYTTCTYCVSGYFLYSNLCFLNIPNCMTRYQLTCMQCAYGYLLNNGNCMGCSSYMPNCRDCSSQTVCTACPNGYTFMAGNVGCAVCSSFMANCTTCNSSTICTACPSGFALADAVTCQFCNVTLLECITCTNTTVCTKCTTGFALASNSTCQSCSSFIPDCLLCSSATNCQKCSPGYSLGPNACTQCTFTMDGCSKCSATNCIECYAGYWYNSTQKKCYDCTADMPKCGGSCTNSTWCNTCSSGYGLMNFTPTTLNGTATPTRNCSSCSTIVSYCATCYDIPFCTSCIDSYYVTYYYYNYYSSGHNDCQPCTWFLNYCSICNNPNSCQACINTGFALYTNNRCYRCSQWMDKCLNCSDYSTCTKCASGSVLVNGRCKPCYVVLPNCNICSSISVCTSCQTTYQLDITTGTCQPCSFFLSNCTLCSSTTTCTQCLPGTILQSAKCKTCAEVFPHCVGCINNVSCAICDQGFVPYQNQCSACENFMSHCSNCLDTFYCQECFDPYVASFQKVCRCKSPLYNVSDYCVADPNCVSAYKKDGQIFCGFCNIAALYYLDANHQCVCKTGYSKINSQCVVICGDGLIINQQCDDNNTIDGDGCSSKCTIQPDFTCSPLPSGMSFCRFVKNIELKYDYTFKMLHENKGRMYFSLLSTNPAVIKFYFSQKFKFTITHNRSNSLNITSFEINSKGQIMIDIEYNETIQDSIIDMKFNFDSSFLISQPCYLKFPLKGTNYPLVISELNQNYQFIYNFAEYVILIEYGLALLLLFSDKFIAVEAVNTIQLTFFSLLLIYANSDWPMAIVALLPLKYSTGFNQLIFKPNPYDNINNNAYRKFQYVGIVNYFVANNLINCIILFVAFFITAILCSIKTKRQNDLLEIKDGSQLKRLSKQLDKFRKVFKKVYNITFHFSYIMILQVILSLFIEFSYLKTISPLMMIADKFLSMLTLTIIFVTVLQNYKHLFLSVKDTYAQNFKIGSWEARYRRVYFIYIFLNAVCIFLLNDKTLFKLTISFFVLIMAVIYMVFLIIYRPYKHSFSIHGFTICFNQMMFIFALIMVNIINFNVQMAEIVYLAFDYLIIGFSLAIMFLATARVFYDWKYGEEQILKKIKLEIDKEKQQQKKRLLNKAAKKQEKKNVNNKNYQNSYLYKNQKLQAQKVDFLNDLKNKSFLTQWEKDHAYFNAYDRKPIGWVLQNQTQEKYKVLLQKEKQRFLNDVEKQKMIKMKNEKLLDNNYMNQLQKIKQKLRNQHGIRQAKKQQKKQEKRFKKKGQNIDK